MVTDLSDEPAVFLFKPEIQCEAMFTPRPPLSEKAKSPGWTGFMIIPENSLSDPDRPEKNVF